MCNSGDVALIPKLGRSPEKGNGNPVFLLRKSHGQKNLAGSCGDKRVGHNLATKQQLSLQHWVSYLLPPGCSTNLEQLNGTQTINGYLAHWLGLLLQQGSTAGWPGDPDLLTQIPRGWLAVGLSRIALAVTIQVARHHSPVSSLWAGYPNHALLKWWETAKQTKLRVKTPWRPLLVSCTPTSHYFKIDIIDWVFKSPQIYLLRHNAQCNGPKRWALWEVIKWGWSRHEFNLYF